MGQLGAVEGGRKITSLHSTAAEVEWRGNGALWGPEAVEVSKDQKGTGVSASWGKSEAQQARPASFGFSAALSHQLTPVASALCSLDFII